MKTRIAHRVGRRIRLLIALLSLGAAGANADPFEPPPESPPGADYEVEPADSIDAGSVEVGMGAAGRAGERVRRSRQVRFRDGLLDGNLREGAGDPLAGGSVESRGAAGAFGMGRLAPRWGRGLVLGAAGDPWSRRALDRGVHAAYRGRAGQGAWAKSGAQSGVELMVARFGHRDLAGARVRFSDWSLGLLGARDREGQMSLAVDREDSGSELALDRAGRWRIEGAMERPLGAWRLAGRVRGGLADFRSLAEPQRSGPAQALTVGLTRASGPHRVDVLGALWRFRAGEPGARAALEVERRLAHHGALAAGFEEQHGVRRDRATAPESFRQGLWGEWRGQGPRFGLTLRHEAWGARPFARELVRTLTAVQLAAAGPAGSSLRVTHSLFRVRRGESLYLPESASDRLVLRAVSGAGARTRVELKAPGGGGWISAGLNLSATATAPRAPRPQWTLNWTRRARTTVRRAKDGEPPPTPEP